jgi:hypothetical protein
VATPRLCDGVDVEAVPTPTDVVAAASDKSGPGVGSCADEELGANIDGPPT